MRKIKSKTRLAIALLIGGFVLASMMLSKAIGAPRISTSASADLKEKYENVFVDVENRAAAVWLNGYMHDKNGNRIGYVSIYAGLSVYEDANQQLVAYYYADATSQIVDTNLNGRANAWVKVPDKPRVGQGQDIMVGRNHPANSVTVSASNTIPANLAGGKAMRASAAFGHDGARVSVRCDVTGI